MLAETSKASFSYRRPFLAVVIIELLLLLAVMAAGTYATIRKLDYTSPVLISFLPIALVLIVYFTWRRKWGAYGFRSLRSIPGKEWIYYLPLAVIVIVLATQGFQAMTPQSVLYFLFFTLLVGFVEETVYRGLILNILLKKGAATAVITSSVLFAITHAANALSGQSAADTAVQIVYSLLIGASLALLMVKHRNIIPLIVFHFLHNFIQFTSHDVTSWGYNLLIVGLLLAHCIWIIVSMRRLAQTA